MKKPTQRKSFGQRACQRVVTAASMLWVAGLAVRLVCQDRFDGLAVLFYATPWPVLMVLPVGPGLWWLRARRHRCAASAAVATAACATAWFHQGWFSNSPVASNHPTLRVLFRNLGHPHGARWRDDLAATARENADLIGLVEAGSDAPVRQRQLREAFPDHVVVGLPHGLVLAVRGEIIDRQLVEFDLHSRCAVARVRIADRTLTVLLVDLESTPWRSRRELFARLDSLLREHAGETVIVMGDFNTPRDSFYFRPWRAGLRHAFETAGQGFAETWPWPLPVLCIDHVWSTPDLPAIQCTRHGYRGHDHAGLLVTFR